MMVLDISKMGKHASSVLSFLSKEGTVKKGGLLEIISSSSTIDRTIEKLKVAGLVSIEEKILGRRIIYISLTPKGRSVAEQLKRAEEISQGKSFTFPDKFAIISYLSDSGPVTLSQLKERYPDALDIIREFESMKVIRQEIDNSKHPPVNRIALTEKGENASKKLRELEEILKR